MEVTQWWKYVDVNGDVVAVGRWYWPESTETETNHGDGWQTTDSFLDMNDDPGWQESTESEVAELVASFG